MTQMQIGPIHRLPHSGRTASRARRRFKAQQSGEYGRPPEPEGDYEGAICDREPDFYRIMVSGDWRVTLNFDASEGDLDMFVFDKDTGNPVLDENGRAVASNGTGDVETIEHSGRAILLVYGCNAASANYTITLEER